MSREGGEQQQQPPQQQPLQEVVAVPMEVVCEERPEATRVEHEEETGQPEGEDPALAPAEPPALGGTSRPSIFGHSESKGSDRTWRDNLRSRKRPSEGSNTEGEDGMVAEGAEGSAMVVAKKVHKEEGRGRNGTTPVVEKKWRSQQAAEDYVNLVGDLMYPRVSFGNFGYDASKGEYSLERPNTLGLMACPIRRPTVIEKWSPLEISLFEGGMSIFGKHFHLIQRMIKTKTTKEVVEFYYIWKMTSHYTQWKRTFEPLELPVLCSHANQPNEE